MRPLSASEAISPAIDRTKDVLFRPFRKGRSWKLAATAYLSIMGCLFIPVPLLLLLIPWIHTPETSSRGAFTAIFFGIVIIYSAIMFAFFYIGARLEFVLFDIVLFKAEFVAPVWNKYAPQTWRWIGLKMICGTVLSIIAGAPLIVWFFRVLPVLIVHPGQPPSPQMFGVLFGFYFALMAVMCLAYLASSLLGNFVLPSLALENTTLSDAMGRFMALLTAEPAQVFFFCFFKVLLGMVALIAMEVATVIVEIVLAIPIAIVAFLGWLILHQLGAAGTLMMTAGVVLLYAVFMGFIFYVTIAIQGCIMTFFQAYAMYFLGGRYPLLGDLMDRFIPQPYSYPAGFAPPPATPQFPPPSSPEPL